MENLKVEIKSHRIAESIVGSKKENQTPKKKWYIEVRVDVLYPDGTIYSGYANKRFRSALFDKKSDAINDEDDYIERVKNKIKTKLLPSLYADYYLKDFMNYGLYHLKWKTSTLVSQKDIIESYIEPYLNGCKLDELDKRVKTFVHDLDEHTYIRKTRHGEEERKYSVNRKIHIYNTMYEFLNYLYNSGIVKKQLTNEFPVKKYKKPEPREENLDIDEFNNFIEIVQKNKQSEWISDFIISIYFTGLRKGEMLALKFSDVNFKSKMISVNKTYHSKYGYSDPKTPSSIRDIEMTDIVYDIFKNIYDNRLKKFNEDEIQNQPVFMVRGAPIADSTLSRHFNPLRNIYEDQYGKHITLHDLRRSHATNVVEVIPDPTYIKQHMGHKHYSTTDTYYTIARKRTTKEYNTKLNNVMNDKFKLPVISEKKD